MGSNIVTPSGGISRIPSVWAEGSLKNDDSMPYHGLWIFSGEQGSGKTLLAMHCAKQILQEYPKCTLISNISIYGIPSLPYRGIDDFDAPDRQFGADGVIYLLDEIHTLWSSLESAHMSPSQLQVWSQNRKNRRVIIGTSQRFNRVAKGLREQAYAVYDCTRPLFGFLYSYVVRDGSDFDDNGRYIGEREPRRYWYVPYVSVMRAYNTLEVVRRPQEGEKKS